MRKLALLLTLFLLAACNESTATAENGCVDEFNTKVANGDLPKDADRDSYVKYCSNTQQATAGKETPDEKSEPFTGEGFVRWGGSGGPNRVGAWQIVRPNGHVSQEGISTEAEARNILRLERLKPRSFVEGEIKEGSPLISVSRVNPIFISPIERLRNGAPMIMEKVGKLKIVARDNLTIQQVILNQGICQLYRKKIPDYVAASGENSATVKEFFRRTSLPQTLESGETFEATVPCYLFEAEIKTDKGSFTLTWKDMPPGRSPLTISNQAL